MVPEKRNQRIHCLLAFFSLLLCTSVLSGVFAQGTRGSLSGRIIDATGSGLPNAHLSLKNTADSTVQVVTANQDGSFTIQNLPPGTYEITASVAAFADVKATVTITADVDKAVNFVMQSGTGSGTG